jgi:transposase InsO family protein
MLIALLALLGVSLVVIVALVAAVAGRRRWLSKQHGAFVRGDPCDQMAKLAHRQRWATRAEARTAVVRWIEGWFNARRLHSTLAHHSPIEYENNWSRHQEGREAA